MIIRWSFPVAAPLALMLMSCNSQAAQSTRTPAPPDRVGIVSGTVSYKERVALPPDAVVEVWIRDVSPLVLVAALIAETTVQPEGRQVPLPFELRYDPNRIVPDHTYAVKAAIRSGGEILFATETDSLVITKGNPTRVDLWLVRPAGQPATASNALAGTAWRLEDLAGAGVLDRIEATLEFAEGGKVSGNASCNRFFGTVTISGQSMTFGPLGSTRKACAEAVGIQEGRYLRALQDAERFTLEGSVLLIYFKGMTDPLRLVRRE